MESASAISILIFSLTGLGALPNYTTNDLINDLKGIKNGHETRVQSCGSTADNLGLAELIAICSPGNAELATEDSYKAESRSSTGNSAN